MEFVRQKRSSPHIEITPLIDIIFQLLLFFMLSSNFISPALKMELPKAMFREKLEKVDLIITMNSKGEIYLNKEQVQLDNLREILPDRMNRLGKYDIIFKGDTSINYGAFVEIMDIAKLAGSTGFFIEHDIRK